MRGRPAVEADATSRAAHQPPFKREAKVSEEVHISSLVVHATPKRLQRVEDAIAIEIAELQAALGQER